MLFRTHNISLAPRFLRLLLVPEIILLVAAAGCGRDSAEPAADSAGPPTTTELENMTYRSFVADSGHVTLAGGSAQVTSTRGGPALIVTLTKFRITGALADHRESAVVVLRISPGGAAAYFDLAAVVRTTSGVKNIALASLGDRIHIRALTLDDKRVILQMRTHAPKDPVCCPTMDVRNTYVLRGEKLVLLKTERDEP